MAQIEIEHSPVFTKNFFSKKKIRVNQGSSRSTKTFSLCQAHIAWSLASPEIHTISRARLTWLKATLIPDYLHVLEHHFQMYDPNRWNKTDSIYRFPNGSETWFIGLDEVQKLHGRKQHRTWINEAIEADYGDFQQLALRTSKTLTLDYNPSSEQHWIYEKVIPRDDCEFIKSTYKDNKFLEQEIIDEIERMEPTPYNIAQGTADEIAWRIYGLGDPAAHRGLIFADASIVKGLPEKDDWKKCFYGLDFGFTNDPTAFFQVVLAHGELWVKQLIYKTGMTNIVNPQKPSQPSIEGKFLELKIDKNTRIWADPAEPKSITDLRNCGFYNLNGADKGQGSITAGLDTLRRYKINITEDSIDLIKEKNNYKWKEDKDGNATNEPIDKWNHGWDAIRYACFMELPRQTAGKVINPKEKEVLPNMRRKHAVKTESYWT